MNQTSEVVICGAGIAGVATAYYLAVAHGVTNLLLIDKHAPLSQTTAKSGENYRNWWPNPHMVHFISRSLDLMDELAASTNNLFQMKRRGYLYATATPDAAVLLDSLTSRYAKLNVGPIRIHHHVENGYLDSLQPAPTSPKPFRDGADILLHPALIREAFPHLSPALTMLMHVRRAGDISVQQLGAHLLAQARARGAQVLTGEVTGIRLDAQGVAGVHVQTKEGLRRVATRRFVNAAGPFAAHVLKMLGAELPIHTVFQQKIAMQDPLGVVPRTRSFTIFLDEQILTWRRGARLLAVRPRIRTSAGQLSGRSARAPRRQRRQHVAQIGLGLAANRAPPNGRRRSRLNFPKLWCAAPRDSCRGWRPIGLSCPRPLCITAAIM
ncbi:MAG: FAD-dependent oxidoreductase [Caldilineaceae bacterium]